MVRKKKPLLNEQQCLRKKSYLSKGDAWQVAEKAFRRRGVKLRAYECPNCHWWHLTKNLLPANDNDRRPPYSRTPPPPKENN